MAVRVYTDGACKGNPGPGGWGAVILFPKKKQVMSGYCKETTNNRMELTAVIEAVQLVLSVGMKTITIHSDSAYVVNAVEKGWLDNWAFNGWKTKTEEDVKNADLWKKLHELMSYKYKAKINFIKVKGHSGDQYNEEADKIARREVDINNDF